MKISRRQLLSLFIGSLIPWIVGNGLLPLLPVYAQMLGANALIAGLYLAVTYFAIAIGALSAGWISGTRLRRKIPIIFMYVFAAPLAWVIGRVHSLWALTIVTALLWFSAGMGLALCNILTGLSVGEDERGKIFGVLALTTGLGSVVGGTGTGWLVKHWGYPIMFTVMAFLLLLGPFAAVFLEEKEDKKSQGKEGMLPEKNPLGRHFFLLFMASILISIGGFIIMLLRSLTMSNIGFDPLEITSTVVIGGLISFPLPLLMGWLSDRMDRKRVLYFGYLISITALVLLAFSKELWHFWLISIFSGIAVGCNSSVGNALVTDLVPRQSLGKGLALFGATTWIGGMLGFALAGFLLQTLDMIMTCLIGGCLGLVAIGLLIQIHAKSRGVDQAGPTSSSNGA